MPTSSSLANSWDSNKVWRQHWHKTASPVTTGSGFWLDLSMAAGTPKFNPYVGDALAYTPLVGAGNNGINAGLGGDSCLRMARRLRLLQPKTSPPTAASAAAVTQQTSSPIGC